MSEYKKYDSEDRYSMLGARLTKDAEVRDGERGKMVRVTFVSTSRAESDDDLWIEANVADNQADLASHLKKGDVLHLVEGKPCLRRYGENKEKFSFNLRRARIVVPLELFAELKKRGWNPQAQHAKATETRGESKPGKPKRPIVDLDD